MPFPLILIPIALALAKGASGYFAARKAKKERESLKEPFYKVQDEYFQNKNLAASQAQGGFDASSLSYLTKENQRGLSSTLGAISQTGNTPNITSDILDQYRNNLEGIGFQDNQLHTAKIQDYMNRNLQLADQKTTQWAQNVLYPYQNKLQLLHQNEAIGKQNMWGGASDLGNIASSYATSRMNNDLNTGNTSASVSQILQRYNNSLERSRQANDGSITGMPRGGPTGGQSQPQGATQPQGITQSSLFQPANQQGVGYDVTNNYEQILGDYKGGEY